MPRRRRACSVRRLATSAQRRAGRDFQCRQCLGVEADQNKRAQLSLNSAPISRTYLTTRTSPALIRSWMTPDSSARSLASAIPRPQHGLSGIQWRYSPHQLWFDLPVLTSVDVITPSARQFAGGLFYCFPANQIFPLLVKLSLDEQQRPFFRHNQVSYLSG